MTIFDLIEQQGIEIKRKLLGSALSKPAGVLHLARPRLVESNCRDNQGRVKKLVNPCYDSGRLHLRFAGLTLSFGSKD